MNASSNPLISTLICTYNAEAFIDSTMRSVLWQTYKNQEILILDNGSKDNTLWLLAEFEKNDSRIKVYSEGKNLWAYDWLNYLLEKAKWKYIAIQDHDDIWQSEKLEKQINFLENNMNYIGCGTWTLMYYGISQIWFTYDTVERDTSKVIHTSIMYRNEWFRYNTENDFLCDGFFMQNILTRGEPILKVLPEVLTLHYYKENGTNYSEQWFKVNPKNIVRYFSVYWYNLYNICLFFYLLIMKMLPFRIRYPFDFWLLKNIKKAQKKTILEWQNHQIKELLTYY